MVSTAIVEVLGLRCMLQEICICCRPLVLLRIFPDQCPWQDFLRKNNTGKLLWQALGNGAQLCICGIEQHEDMMWAAFQEAGLVLLLNCYRLVL